MRRAVLALSALLCALHTPAAAQQAPVQPDQVVRVQAPAAGLRGLTIGTVVDVRGDSVTLQLSQRDTIRGGEVLQQRAVALRDVHRMEVAVGTASRTRGAVLGTAIGTGAGLAAAALHMRFSNRPSESVPCDYIADPLCLPESRLLPYEREKFVGITVAGTLLGTAAGAVFSGRRWRHVYPVAPAAGSAPGGGLELGATLRF